MKLSENNLDTKFCHN